MQELNDWEICFIVSGCEIELERTTIESHANKEAYEEHLSNLNSLMDRVDPKKNFRNA